MISQAVTDFCQDVQFDPTALERLQPYAHDPELFTKAIVKLAELRGHALDRDDVRTSLQNAANASAVPTESVELSDEELEGVQGGFFFSQFADTLLNLFPPVAIQGVTGIVSDPNVKQVASDASHVFDPLNLFGLR